MKNINKNILLYIILLSIIVINLLLVCLEYNLLVIIIDLLLTVLFIYLLYKIHKINKDNNEMIRMLPHDIKTPINSIKCLLELMKVDSNDVSKLNNYIDKINYCLDHINNISLNILDKEYENVKREDVSVNGLIDDVSSLIMPVIKNKNIVFNIMKLKEDYVIKTDYQKLKQILINLLSNSSKYTPKFGSITIEALESKEEIIFNVIDTGIGISEKMLSSLFDKGSRGSSDNIEGHGYGLALCKQMVLMLDGLIEVKSKLNYGSKFSVKLKKEEVSYLEKGNILIVDDSKLNADLLGSLLTKFGYNVNVLYNPLEVIDELNNKEKDFYKAVITDMIMPGLDGNKLSEKIREINSDVVIICLSGEKVKKNKNINYCLLKPVDIKLLIKMID